MSSRHYLSVRFAGSGQFVRQLRSFQLPPIPATLACCQFDATHYRPALFAEQGMALPASLHAAVDQRQAEFLAGRLAARQALAALAAKEGEPGAASLADQPIGIGPRRAPQWPAAISGAISHDDGVAICAVGRLPTLLGLDLLRCFTSSQVKALAPLVMRGDEAALLAGAGLSAGLGLSLLFSAKESLFKALSPRLQSYREFDDARVVAIEARAGRMQLQLASDWGEGFCRGDCLTAHWRRLGHQWLTYLVHVDATATAPS